MAFAVPTVGAVGVGGGATTVVPQAAGVAVGDILFMLMSGGQSGADITLTPPAGWTLLSATGMSKVYGRLADASDVAAGSYTITDAGGISLSTVNGVIVRVPGPYTALPTYFHSQSFSGTGSISDATGITPTEQQGILLQLIADGNTTAIRTSSTYAIATNNPAWTELLDTGSTSSGSWKPHLAVAYGNWTSPSGTATGAVSFTISGTSAGVLVSVHIPGIPFTFTAAAATATAATLTFVRQMLVSAATAVGAVGAAVFSDVAPTVRNAARHTASWINRIRH